MTTSTTTSTTSTDPRAVLSGALDRAGRVLAAVRPADLGRPTPCPEYTVRDLAAHLVAVARRLAVLGRGGDAFALPGLADDVAGDGWADAFGSAVREVTDVWADPAVLDRELRLPFGTHPGSVIAVHYAGEFLVHAWDLAVATGQRPVWDPALLAPSLAAMRQALPADRRGGPVPFGPVVTGVPDDAPGINRLVAWYGRRPGPRGRIVVTGAGGNVGAVLTAALTAAGERVTAVSRQAADPAARADLADPDSLRLVLAAAGDAEALFLLVPGGGHELDPDALIDAIAQSPVRRLVLLSSQVAGTRPDAVSHAGLRAFEDAVRRSGLAWTILRPGGFASNAFAWAGAVREHRLVAAPFGDVALPVIDPADIAEVAAAVLRSDAHAGRTYVLTGPAPVTPREQAAALGAALGEPVAFRELTRAEAGAAMAAFMPEPVVEGTLSVLGEPLPAERAVSGDVEAVLGRPAGTFEAWARRHAAAFR